MSFTIYCIKDKKGKEGENLTKLPPNLITP